MSETRKYVLSQVKATFSNFQLLSQGRFLFYIYKIVSLVWSIQISVLTNGMFSFGVDLFSLFECFLILLLKAAAQCIL